MKILEIKHDNENNMEIEIEINGEKKVIKLTEEESGIMFSDIVLKYIKENL